MEYELSKRCQDFAIKTFKYRLMERFEEDPNLKVKDAMSYVWMLIYAEVRENVRHTTGLSGQDLEREANIIYHIAEDICVLKDKPVLDCTLDDYFSGRFRHPPIF